MKRRQNSNRNDWLSILTSLLLVIVLLPFTGDVLARKKDETKATGAIDAKTFEVLTKAQELAEADRYAEAIQTLNTIKHSDKLNSYARSQMWNFYAFIYASQEKYREAIGAYKKILAEVDAPDGLILTAKYTMAQLYFQLEDYQSVINFMEAWIREISKPTATAHIMLAQAYYQTKIYDPALNNLLKAIDIEKAQGKKVKENWLRMKAAIYFEKDDTKNTLKTYEELLHHYPSITYLRQIAGLHGELGNERKRLTTYDAIYLEGALKKESEFLVHSQFCNGFREYHIGTSLNTGTGSVNCRIKTFHRQGIGSRHYDKIRICPGIDGSFNTVNHFRFCDNGLLRAMATAFLLHLIFNVNCSSTGLNH